MANVLSLAMKISADATGVRQSLSPVEKALNQLDKEAASVTAVFKKFGSESAAAAAQQEKFEVRLRALTESLKAGLTSPQDYARSLEQLQMAANDAASDLGRAAQIVEANLTKEQRATKAYEQSIAELNRLRDAGLLDETQYGLAVQRSAESFAKATVEANKYAAASDKAGDGGTLKFNELSGVLSALPGPIGNVAGRLSGLSSAGEGLARVFGGGLSQGITSIGASVAGLINPFTAAVAGVAAFGAGAAAVVQGLTALEDRVEKLGNTADKLGVSFEFIQTLEEAANRSGTSIDAVSAAFGRLQKSVLGVDEESKAAQKALAEIGVGHDHDLVVAALAEIGVTAEELQALSPEEQYLRIGESLNSIEDPARRTAAATALFGRAGADLLPFFRNIGGAAEDMERFGATLSGVDRTNIDQLGASFDAANVAVRALSQNAITPFLGVVASLTDIFADFIGTLARVAGTLGDLLSPALNQFGRTLEVVSALVGSVGGVIISVFDGIAKAITPFADYLLPLAVGHLIRLNAAVAVGAISSLATFMGTAATAAYAFATGAGTATVSVAALGAAIRASLASTGVGALVVGVGLAANALIEWATSADDAAKNSNDAADGVKNLTAGFADVSKAIAGGDKALDSAIAKAGEFGQAGFDAALEFQNALADLKEQADNNELNGEQYARGVANATAEFDKQIDSLRTVQEETRKAADEAKRRAEADKQVADQLLEQARIQRDFGGDTERAQAAGQVLAIERDIARARQDVEAARGDGDEQAVANGEERIRQLEEIRNQQQVIANDADGTARAEAQRLVDQKQRIDELIAAQNQQSQIERDIADVQEERARVEADRVAAVQAGRSADAQAAQERLNQLDSIQVKLDEQQRGFTNGYEEAFAATEEGFRRAVDKAAEFGLAGVEASQQLQEGIAAAQQQARDGIFTKEAYEAEVQRQNDLFDQRLEQEKQLAAERKKQDAERARIQQEQEQTVNALIKEQFGEDPRVKAAENLKAIEAEIARAQEDAQKARDVGDKEAAAAAAKRLAQLDQVQAKERDIASGAAAQREAFQKRQQQLAEAQAKQQQQIFQQQQKFAEEQAKAQQAEFDRQQKRLTELNTLGPRQVQTADVRTQEGQQIVFDLFNQQQDPQLIQLRLLNKVMTRIATSIDRDLNRLGQPATIL